MQFRIACTLQLYIKQLQSLRGEQVGALEDGMVTGGLFTYEEYGPFESPLRFRRWCEFVALTGWKDIIHAGTNKASSRPSYDRDWCLVFTHGDLSTHNIIVDKRGVLWLIDWDSAGFYPPCFESLAMRLSEDQDFQGQSSWIGYRSFIAGKVKPSQEWFWDCFRVQ